jgi:hypothetical protein
MGFLIQVAPNERVNLELADLLERLQSDFPSTIKPLYETGPESSFLERQPRIAMTGEGSDITDGPKIGSNS